MPASVAASSYGRSREERYSVAGRYGRYFATASRRPFFLAGMGSYWRARDSGTTARLARKLRLSGSTARHGMPRPCIGDTRIVPGLRMASLNFHETI